jgi:hypothetical protein
MSPFTFPNLSPRQSLVLAKMDSILRRTIGGYLDRQARVIEKISYFDRKTLAKDLPELVYEPLDASKKEIRALWVLPCNREVHWFGEERTKRAEAIRYEWCRCTADTSHAARHVTMVKISLVDLEKMQNQNEEEETYEEKGDQWETEEENDEDDLDKAESEVEEVEKTESTGENSVKTESPKTQKESSDTENIRQEEITNNENAVVDEAEGVEANHDEDDEEEYDYQSQTVNTITAEYEALSYVWGPAKPSYPVLVNNTHLLQVGESLWWGLARIVEDYEKPRLVWIDAICINQKDNEEKAWQVQLMGEIYRRAKGVIVYLGEDSRFMNDVAKEVDKHHKIASALANANEKRTIWELSDNERSKYGLQANQMSKSTSHELEFIEDQTWFSRVWIIQEFWLAKECVFYLGEYKIPGEELRKTLVFMRDYDLYSFAGLQVSEPDHVNRLLADQPRYKSGEFRKLWDLLGVFRSARATDSRDKVYGMLGMLAETEAKAIVVDYTKPANHVYMDTAGYFLTKGLGDDPLVLLSKAGRSTGYNGEGSRCPSWVPDWSSAGLCRPLPAVVAGEVNASKGSISAVHKILKGWKLQLEGHWVDSINKMTDPNFLPYQLPRVGAASWDGKEFWKRFIRSQNNWLLMNRWRDEVIPTANDNDGVYQSTGEPALHAFWKTVWARNVETEFFSDEKAFIAAVEGRALEWWWRDKDFWKKATSWSTSDDDKDSPKDMWHKGLKAEMEGRMSKLRKDRKENMVWVSQADKWLVTTYGRKMVLLSKGCIGLVPDSTRETDVIFLFKGAKCPYVVREIPKSNQEYQLIGECYVHGMMQGEAWDETKVGQVLLI